MNVLLDENIPRKLRWRLKERGLELVTVPDRGWAGVTNGELLNRAEGEFDALLMMDQGIESAEHSGPSAWRVDDRGSGQRVRNASSACPRY